MFMRFLGGGVGHSVMKEKQTEPEAPCEQHTEVDGDADAPDQVFDVQDTDEEEASEGELDEEEDDFENLHDNEFGPEDGEDGGVAEDFGYGEL
jgi:hypothetical protein